MSFSATKHTLPTVMNFGDKVKEFRLSLNLKRPAFAKAIGVSVDTIQRAESQTPDKPNDYLFGEIVRAYPGIRPYLDGTEDSIPATVSFSMSAVDNREKNLVTDGTRLKSFLSRRNIQQKELASLLDRSPAQINHYLKSETIRPDIKREISAALKVDELTIWPILSTSAPFKLSDLVALPVISAQNRNTLTYQSIKSALENFDPKSEKSFYLHKEAIGTERIEDAFIVEISRFDNMQPVLPAGSLALAVLLSPEEYDNMTNDFVLIAVGSNVIVRKIKSNNLRVYDSLELSTLDGYTGTLSVRRSDIEFMCVLKKSIVDL